MKKIDLSLPSGILLAFVIVVISISTSGSKGGFMLFFNLPSMMMVLGATLLITMSSFALSEIISGFVIAFQSAFYKSPNVDDAISEIIYTYDKIRKNGFLSLQDKLGNIHQFGVFARGIQMYIDGFNVRDVVSSAEQLAYTMDAKKEKSIELIEKASEIAPGMGLIGTLVGLIQLLVNITDTSSIGPAMGYALITTFYGSILSFMFFSPIASRIGYIHNQETLLNKIFIQGLLGIGEEQNPIQLKIILRGIAGGSSDLDL